jgi:hypothetical protein
VKPAAVKDTGRAANDAVEQEAPKAKILRTP